MLKYQIHLKAPFFFIIFILSIIGFVPTNHLYAQAKKKPVKKNNKQINRMALEISRPDSVAPYMITAEGDTINRTDEFNLKQGVWVERTEERFGEPAFTKIGKTLIVAVTGVFEVFVAVNDGSVLGPEATRPILVLLFVQL